jgi:hypothetical protein
MLCTWGITGGFPPFGDSLLLLVAGQSNATRRASKVTTSYRSQFYTFNGVNEAVDRVDGQAVQTALPGSYFESLVAFSDFGINSESVAPGYAAVDTHDTVLTFAPAVGARDYRTLKYGGEGPWEGLIQALQQGKALLTEGDATSIDYVLLWDHGEADADLTGSAGAEGPITQAEYLAVLQDLVTQYTFCASRALLDVAFTPIVWGTAPCIVSTDAYRNVQNAHLQAAQTVSGYNLVGPKYAYAHESDGTHITGAGKRLFAEYIAKRVAQGGLPVHITSATRSAAVITLNYDTITGNLVIDTTAVPATNTAFPNSLHGFECLVGGTPQTINDVSVSGTQVTITLSADPGAPVLVRYAQQTWPGASQTVSGINSKLARGNIRDSGSHTALQDGSTLYNWACHQYITTST